MGTNVLGQIVVKVTGETAQFEQSIDRSHKRFIDFGSKIKFVSLGIGAALVGIGAAAVKASADMERQVTAFTTLLGSGEKAKKLLKELETLGAKTPLELTNLTQNANTLLQYGISASQVTDTLRMLGDTAQGNAQRLDSLTLAFAQSAAAGRANMQDIRQMINAGFNPLTIVAEKTGETMDALSKRMSAGGVSFQEIADAFKTATSEGGRFFNAMQAQSQTFEGRLSTLKDNIAIASRNLGDLLLPVAGQVMEIVSDLIEQISSNKEFFTALSGAIAKIGEIISKLLPILSKLLTAIAPIVSAFADLAANLADALFPIIDAVAGVFSQLAPVIADILGLIGQLVQILSPFIKLIASLVKPLLEPLMAILKMVVKLLQPILDLLGELTKMLDTKFGKSLMEILNIVLKLLNPLAMIYEMLKLLGVITEENTDLEKAFAKQGEEYYKDYVSAVQTSADEIVKKQQELNQARLDLENEWREKLFYLKASETEKIEYEYQKAIEAARKAGADTKDIEEYYSLQRRKILEDELKEWKDKRKSALEYVLDLAKTESEKEEEEYRFRRDVLKDYIDEHKKILDEAIAEEKDPFAIIDDERKKTIERETELLRVAYVARTKLAENFDNKIAEINRKQIQGYAVYYNAVFDIFSSLGEALAGGAEGWVNLGRAALNALAAIIDALSNESIAQGIKEIALGLSDTATAATMAAGVYTAALAPGFAAAAGSHYAAAAGWGALGVTGKVVAGVIRGLSSQIKLGTGGIVMPQAGGVETILAERGVPEVVLPDQAPIWKMIGDRISQNMGVTNVYNNNMPGRLVLNIDGKEMRAWFNDASRNRQVVVDPNCIAKR